MNVQADLLRCRRPQKQKASQPGYLFAGTPVKEDLSRLCPHEGSFPALPGQLQAEEAVQLRLHARHHLCALAEQIRPQQVARRAAAPIDTVPVSISDVCL